MIVKRSLTIRGHQTSISIEDEFWAELKAIAARRALPLAALVASIDTERDPGRNLSSAIRVHVLKDALARKNAQPGETGSSGNGATPGRPS